MDSRRATIDVQIASQAPGLPTVAQLRCWAQAALSEIGGNPEITVRIVDETESAELNRTYRRVSGPTNVLSFPFESPQEAQLPLLGDVVICAPLVEEEAREQNKTVEAHWAHMVVHGTLHLLGYDHQSDGQAARMESEERRILAQLGITDPYLRSV
ncbi:MAG TPA: rRNA maturation RNase YbeY [Gammaproteobacteria bacterium]|nr:rRNA maturation RNase YbeY [Gammaproteobacteria bacterium]